MYCTTGRRRLAVAFAVCRRRSTVATIVSSKPLKSVLLRCSSSSSSTCTSSTTPPPLAKSSSLPHRYITTTTGGYRHLSSAMSSSSPSSNEPSLEVIRETLRSFDVESGPSSAAGRLDLSMDDGTGIATLCINSPARKNAWSGAMMAQFSDVLTVLEGWEEGRAVIIYGADGFFCSGADLKTVQRSMELEAANSKNSNNSSNTSSSFTSSGAYYIATLMHDNFRRLEALPLVSVALVEGKAIGGGAEVVASTDLRVFAADAQIGFVHGRLGLTPGFGGGCRLVRLLGPTRALQMMLSARPVGVAVAKELGLVEHVLSEGLSSGEASLGATIAWYHAHYGSISVHASRHLKAIVGQAAAASLTMAEALKFEAAAFQAVWGSEEHRASLANNVKHN